MPMVIPGHSSPTAHALCRGSGALPSKLTSDSRCGDCFVCGDWFPLVPFAPVQTDLDEKIDLFPDDGPETHEIEWSALVPTSAETPKAIRRQHPCYRCDAREDQHPRHDCDGYVDGFDLSDAP